MGNVYAVRVMSQRPWSIEQSARSMMFPDWMTKGATFKAHGYKWQIVRVDRVMMARRWSREKKRWHYRYFRDHQINGGDRLTPLHKSL